MLAWLANVSPWVAAVSIGVGISLWVTDKIPEHAGKVRAGAWVVAGAAIGTAILPGIGTGVGIVVGALIAWATS